MSSMLLYAFAAALLAVIVLGYVGIPILKKMHARQSIREEGPQNHLLKAGTPTMGGVFIVLAIVVTSMIFLTHSPVLWLTLLLVVGHAALGFFDDFIKAVKKRNLGLTAKQKLVGQMILAGVFSYIGETTLELPTTLWIPAVNVTVELGMLYYVLVFFIIVGATNAVNLTDGLDGLASGTMAIASATYSIIALMAGQDAVAIFGVIVCGSCVGFLWFNIHPAKVFMGDTGSLALGAAIAAMAILTKTELLLVIVGGIFVMEAMSVIIQVISFKTRGVRVFKMSPVHHHFELSGWREQKVVIVFWITGIILSLIGLALMTFRQ